MKIAEAKELIDLPLGELLCLADRIRREGVGKRVEICGIINAKSGACGEDCKFCAQSAHYRADIPEYAVKTADEIVEAAKKARDNGAACFGIVTSGNSPGPHEIKIIADAVNGVKEKAGIIPCASLGALDKTTLAELREAGLSRYHHNIETSERFYPKIVSTHTFEDRLNTLRNAKSAGLEVCSGGILGMGESWQDRIDMAILLAELEVDAVPLNFLIPINGTPLGGTETISPFEAVRAIALFRAAMPRTDIKVVAGRESILKDYQGMLYTAGANGMMVGGYLTVAGRSVEEDNALISEVRELWETE